MGLLVLTILGFSSAPNEFVRNPTFACLLGRFSLKGIMLSFTNFVVRIHPANVPYDPTLDYSATAAPNTRCGAP